MTVWLVASSRAAVAALIVGIVAPALARRDVATDDRVGPRVSSEARAAQNPIDEILRERDASVRDHQALQPLAAVQQRLVANRARDRAAREVAWGTGLRETRGITPMLRSGRG